MGDKELVREFLNNRDESSFQALYRSKTPHLYQMALRLTQDKFQSEELIQETWIIAIRKLPDFMWKSDLKTWLIGILINIYRSWRRKAEGKSVTATELSSIALEADRAGHDLEVKDIEQAIAQLPPGYRQTIILHDIEGYKHKEIAQILDISEGTSKSQLFHARKALREYLKKENLNPGSYD